MEMAYIWRTLNTCSEATRALVGTASPHRSAGLGRGIFGGWLSRSAPATRQSRRSRRYPSDLICPFLNRVPQVRILPGAPCDVAGHRNGSEPSLGSGPFWFRAGWSAGGLVVAGGVQGQFADEFACCGVDDANVRHPVSTGRPPDSTPPPPPP